MMIRDRIRELRRVRAADLRPHPANWRTHPPEQQDALRGILAEVGYADALLTRELPDGSLQLIDGHLRAETTPDQHVPVLILDVNEAEAAKLLAVLDPLAALATADAAKLDALLADVDTENEALQQMLNYLAKDSGLSMDEDPVITEDEVPIDRMAELQRKWNTKRGQLWQIGEHRLLCGDATMAEDVGRVIGDDDVSLLITDPPYGVEYDPKWRNEAAANGHIAFACKREGDVANDDRIDWTEAWQLTKATVAYVWHDGKHATRVQDSLERSGFEVRSQIIWAKDEFVISRGHYHWQHEPCWYAVRKWHDASWIGDRSQSTLWKISKKIVSATDHGTQKPVECMARAIRNHEGDVYDPFLGSGTTMVAAQHLGRRCCGIEIEPKYVAVVLERLAALGLEPRLA